MKVPLNGTLWEILYNSNLQWSHNINISKVGSTMMMCSDMSVERDYMEVLNTVTTYKIDGNSLIFFDKNNKEIARFIKR